MQSFYEAFINTEHKVFGKVLKPFSLKHCLYLESIDSPVVKLINGDEVEITSQDLQLAVIVCSSDDPIKALRKNAFGNVLFRFYNYKRNLTKFLSYLHDYISFPEIWENSDSDKKLNTPWILSKAILLLSKTSLTKDEIWNMPLGELVWYVASFAEQEGLLEIQSEDELNAIEEAIKNAK